MKHTQIEWALTPSGRLWELTIGFVAGIISPAYLEKRKRNEVG